MDKQADKIDRKTKGTWVSKTDIWLNNRIEVL